MSAVDLLDAGLGEPGWPDWAEPATEPDQDTTPPPWLLKLRLDALLAAVADTP